MLMTKMRKISSFLYILIFLLIILLIIFVVSLIHVHAEPFNIPNVNVDIGPSKNASEAATSLNIIFLMTILSLAPSILIMMTSFTRIIIVLSFVRNAIGVQQMPPNQVLVGLALFLSFFVMSPVITEINTTAYQPFVQNKITQQEAMTKAMVPIRTFMMKQTDPKDINLFLSLSKSNAPSNVDEISNTVVIPAFIISELKTAFQIGFFIFIPFLIIDMIVSSTLMTMGMMMLPPMMISLPFKILLFVMVDGWHLVIKTLITGFK